MEKSGLKGNDSRDFNLLQEITHYAAAELDSDVGLEQRLRMHLGMRDEPRNAADSRAASGTKVATLLLLNALMLHSRIERAGGRIARQLRTKLERIGRDDDPPSALINSWTTILDHDYKPVFQPARRVAAVIRDSEYRTAGWRAVRPGGAREEGLDPAEPRDGPGYPATARGNAGVRPRPAARGRCGHTDPRR